MRPCAIKTLRGWLPPSVILKSEPPLKLKPIMNPSSKLPFYALLRDAHNRHSANTVGLQGTRREGCDCEARVSDQEPQPACADLLAGFLVKYLDHLSTSRTVQLESETSSEPGSFLNHSAARAFFWVACCALLLGLVSEIHFKARFCSGPAPLQ